MEQEETFFCSIIPISMWDAEAVQPSRFAFLKCSLQSEQEDIKKFNKFPQNLLK